MRKGRHLQMAREFGLTAYEQLTCGCHVHVSISSADEGVAVLDRIRPWLPTELLAAVLARGNGADFQRRAFRDGSLASVIESTAAITVR